MLWDLSWMISETVSTLPTRFAAQSSAFEAMKRREISDKEAHDLAIRFWDAGAIGAIEISRIIKEWREPRHPEFAETKNAWRLFNAVTETIKGDLWRLPARTRAIHDILSEALEIPTNVAGGTVMPQEVVELAT